MSKKPLSKALKNFYGVGDFFYDIQASYKTYYWNIFLTSIACLPLPLIAILNTIVSTCEIFMSPFYGAVMDGMKPMKWGRYRSIILFFTPIMAILFVAQWFVSGFVDPKVALVPLVILALLYAVFFNMSNTANMTLISIVSDTEADRSRLSSRRWAWINFDKVVLGTAVTALLALFAPMFGEGSVTSYSLVGAVFGITAIGGMAFHFKLTKGYEEENATVQKGTKKQANTLGAMVKTIAKNPPLLALFCAQCFTSTVSFILAMMAAYQFNMALGAPAMLAFYLAATNIGAACGSLVSGFLAKKLEAKRISQLCLPICIVFLALARVFGANPLLFTIFILGERTFSNCNFATFVTLYSNCAVYAEYKTGVKNAGLVMGISNVPVKIAVLITGNLIPFILASTGYDAAATVIPEAVKSGITNAITLIPLCCYAVAFVIITFAFRLPSKEVARMQEEINSRNANNA